MYGRISQIWAAMVVGLLITKSSPPPKKKGKDGIERQYTGQETKLGGQKRWVFTRDGQEYTTDIPPADQAE